MNILTKMKSKKVEAPKSLWKGKLVNLGILSSGVVFCGGLYAYYRYFQVKKFESKFKEIIQDR